MVSLELDMLKQLLEVSPTNNNPTKEKGRSPKNNAVAIVTTAVTGFLFSIVTALLLRMRDDMTP